ncbi:outer membrane transport energization protein TonB [Acidovorax sp. 69]|uniref:energy transducer TonB n=2 Tax=unclassified Acidovorax TaxID=2684926 RepID=UPI000C232D0D|nr:energy transducer TonB [Acidovorax sp. 69]PJI97144.1 outer membrane transport energization protein TonB [Acidovorax sp. 69]
MSHPDRFATPGGVSRNAVIVGSVVALHVAGLWALQSGLLRRAAEIIVPAELLSEFIAPPAPKIAPPPPPVPPPPKPAPKVAPRPAPMPVAIADPTPAPNAPTGVTTPQPPAPPMDAPVVAPSPTPAPPAPPSPPAPPRIELPSSDAAYLNNPKPSYPAISKRMGEQGKVVLRVLIGTDGLPQKVEISKSSGFDRLDRQAQEAVMRWRFVPGKRNGVAETMWNLVPVNFVLE